MRLYDPIGMDTSLSSIPSALSVVKDYSPIKALNICKWNFLAVVYSIIKYIVDTFSILCPLVSIFWSQNLCLNCDYLSTSTTTTLSPRSTLNRTTSILKETLVHESNEIIGNPKCELTQTTASGWWALPSRSVLPLQCLLSRTGWTWTTPTHVSSPLVAWNLETNPQTITFWTILE